MNERIRELSRQVVISMRAEHTGLPPLEELVIQKILELREQYDKKFAELLLVQVACAINSYSIANAECDKTVALLDHLQDTIQTNLGPQEKKVQNENH